VRVNPRVVSGTAAQRARPTRHQPPTDWTQSAARPASAVLKKPALAVTIGQRVNN